MAQARKKKVAVYMSEEDYQWWSNRAWMARNSTSLFINDQLIAVRREIERAEALRNHPNQKRQPSLQPRSGSGGPIGDSIKK